MKKIKHIAFIVILFLFSCESKKISQSTEVEFKEDIGLQHTTEMSGDLVKGKSEKVINGIHFRLDVLSAMDYLQHKETFVDTADRLALEKESVVLLKISLDNDLKKLFEDNRITMNKDQAVQYLMAGIQKDILIEQSDREVLVNGMSYEGQIGTADNVKIVFFVSGLNKKENYTVSYYDRLFGKGIIKYKSNTKDV